MAHDFISNEASLHRVGYKIINFLIMIDHDMAFSEIMYFILDIRGECVQLGYNLPKLSEISLSMSDYLKYCPIKATEVTRMVQRTHYLLKWLEQNYENGYRMAIDLDINLDDFDFIGPELSENGAIAFCWGLAGALLLIIPHPVATALGSMMIGKAMLEVGDELQDKAAK